jgi:chaperonin GroES
MAEKIIPLGKRLVIKPKKEEEVTSFGMVLSDSGKEKPMQGEVFSISNDIDKDLLQVGDTVLFKKYSPTEFTLEKEEYYVLDLEDVLAKLS